MSQVGGTGQVEMKRGWYWQNDVGAMGGWYRGNGTLAELAAADSLLMTVFTGEGTHCCIA